MDFPTIVPGDQIALYAVIPADRPRDHSFSALPPAQFQLVSEKMIKTFVQEGIGALPTKTTIERDNQNYLVDKEILLGASQICVTANKIRYPVNQPRHFRTAERLHNLGRHLFFHVLEEDDDFLPNGLVDPGDGDAVFSATFFNEAVDEDRLLGYPDCKLESFSIFACSNTIAFNLDLPQYQI